MMSLEECYDALGGNYKAVLGRLSSERIVKKFVLKFLNDQSYVLLEQSMQDKNYEARRFQQPPGGGAAVRVDAGGGRSCGRGKAGLPGNRRCDPGVPDRKWGELRCGTEYRVFW